MGIERCQEHLDRPYPQLRKAFDLIQGRRIRIVDDRVKHVVAHGRRSDSRVAAKDVSQAAASRLMGHVPHCGGASGQYSPSFRLKVVEPNWPIGEQVLHHNEMNVGSTPPGINRRPDGSTYRRASNPKPTAMAATCSPSIATSARKAHRLRWPRCRPGQRDRTCQPVTTSTRPPTTSATPSHW